MKRIGINLRPDISYGPDRFLDCISAVGFDSIFTMGNDEEFISHVCDKCNENGLRFESLHAPFDNINDIWHDSPEGEKMLNTLLDTVTLADRYNIPIVVSHLSSKENCPPVTDAGLRHFDKLISYAAEKSITVAFENQRKIGNIATMLELYGKDTNVGFCWDNGHEKCFAHGHEFMPLFGDRAICTHFHDNNGKYNIDEHLLPFDGSIDFRRVAELIKNSGYAGTLMLEIDLPHDGSEKYRNLTAEQFAAKAYAAINRLRILAE